jgi:hypothetical protein
MEPSVNAMLTRVNAAQARIESRRKQEREPEPSLIGAALSMLGARSDPIGDR